MIDTLEPGGYPSAAKILMKHRVVRYLVICSLVLIARPQAQAWDYEGHRLVNQLALASLPTNFPSFVKGPAAAERIAFLAGEPDRWRNTPDLTLKQDNGPEHYIDIEELEEYDLKPEQLPIFRYDFQVKLALYRAAHPDKFHAPDPAKNEDHTRQMVGLLPWAMTDMYAKLKSGFSYLKAFEESGGTPEEIANAQQNIIYVMGVMGHFYGDSSQPLHTTIHHHGWIGSNPNHYSTNSRIHSWIDGGFFNKIGGEKVEELKGKLRPARLIMIGERNANPEEVFQVCMNFIGEQNKFVEPLYMLDRDGKLSGDGATRAEGREFLEKQLVKGAQLLGDIWYSAWQEAPPDTFLKSQLARRKHKPADD